MEKMNSNPISNIDSRLQAVEAYLATLDNRFTPSLERWGEGIDIACEILEVKTHVVLNNIDAIPHKQAFNALYFNRIDLENFRKDNAQRLIIWRSE
jgi:hypothetical protein